jgi:hypothetical protein
MAIMAQVLQGWDALAQFMGVSRRTAISMKPELEEAGVLLYKRKGRARRRVAFSYDVLIIAFMREKFSEREKIT